MRAAVAWFSQKLMLGLASTLEINIVNELRVLLTPAHPLQGAVSQFEWVTLYPDNPQKVNKRFGVAWHSKLAMVSWRNYTKVPWSFHLCSHHFNQIAVEIHLQKLTMKPPETPSSSHAKTIDGHTFFLFRFWVSVITSPVLYIGALTRGGFKLTQTWSKSRRHQMHIVWTFKIKARALTINAFYTAGLNTICNKTGRVCVCVCYFTLVKLLS